MDSSMAELEPLERSDPETFLAASRELYNSVLQELVRQVSLDCVDRGRVLARVWVRFMALFQHLTKQAQLSQMNYEHQTQLMKEDLVALRDLYDKDVSSLRDALQGSFTDLDKYHKIILMKTIENRNQATETDALKKRIEFLEAQLHEKQNEGSLSHRLLDVQEKLGLSDGLGFAASIPKP
eukprot:ANDGO_00274.mRNA.1 hypothetical protein